MKVPVKADFETRQSMNELWRALSALKGEVGKLQRSTPKNLDALEARVRELEAQVQNLMVQ